MPDPITPVPAPPADPPSATPPAATEPPAPEPVTPSDPPAPEPSPWDDNPAAKAEIERLRKENGAARTKAKADAATEARNELAQTIGKALGLVRDDAPIDPAQLTSELTAEKEAAKHARVELAVFRAAGAAGGDPNALLDSTSFLRSLADVDPTDTAAVTAAIQVAVTTNPRLGAATDPRPPAPHPGQGATAGAPGLDAQIAEATKAGNHALAISLKRQKAYAGKPN